MVVNVAVHSGQDLLVGAALPFLIILLVLMDYPHFKVKEEARSVAVLVSKHSGG